MTEEAKHVIEVIDMLNKCNDTPCFKCKKLEFNGLAACEDEESFYRNVASMIESLSEQLEQVTRERDAAVECLRGRCFVCANARPSEKIPKMNTCEHLTAAVAVGGAKMDAEVE